MVCVCFKVGEIHMILNGIIHSSVIFTPNEKSKPTICALNMAFGSKHIVFSKQIAFNYFTLNLSQNQLRNRQDN